VGTERIPAQVRLWCRVGGKAESASRVVAGRRMGDEAEGNLFTAAQPFLSLG